MFDSHDDANLFVSIFLLLFCFLFFLQNDLNKGQIQTLLMFLDFNFWLYNFIYVKKDPICVPV